MTASNKSCNALSRVQFRRYANISLVMRLRCLAMSSSCSLALIIFEQIFSLSDISAGMVQLRSWKSMFTVKCSCKLWSTAWLAMLGFVSVGYTPQTTDICVCRQHFDNVGPTRWRHSLKSAFFFADKVVSGNRIPDTLSYVYVGIITDEVI
jgi:hypothetical protein